jgi:hypothetical protein
MCAALGLLSMDSNPPTVAGMPSRIEDIFTPVWTTVVGGPAAEQDPGRWLFAAYTEVTDLTIETARKLQERSAPATSPLRRVESLGEHAGYTRYRTERSKYLFLVRNDGVATWWRTSLRDLQADSPKRWCFPT